MQARDITEKNMAAVAVSHNEQEQQNGSTSLLLVPSETAIASDSYPRRTMSTPISYTHPPTLTNHHGNKGETPGAPQQLESFALQSAESSTTQLQQFQDDVFDQFPLEIGHQPSSSRTSSLSNSHDYRAVTECKIEGIKEITRNAFEQIARLPSQEAGLSECWYKSNSNSRSSIASGYSLQTSNASLPIFSDGESTCMPSGIRSRYASRSFHGRQNSQHSYCAHRRVPSDPNPPNVDPEHSCQACSTPQPKVSSQSPPIQHTPVRKLNKVDSPPEERVQTEEEDEKRGPLLASNGVAKPSTSVDDFVSQFETPAGTALLRNRQKPKPQRKRLSMISEASGGAAATNRFSTMSLSSDGTLTSPRTSFYGKGILHSQYVYTTLRLSQRSIIISTHHVIEYRVCYCKGAL